MNDRYNSIGSPTGGYNGDYLAHEDQEIKTSQNLETIERLFDEWDDEDKNTPEAFSLDEQSFESNPLSYNTSESVTPTPTDTSSFYDEPSHNTKYDGSTDPMDQTREIDSVDLAELKALQEELHRLYDEPEPEPIQENPSQTQSKGKTLTKATKQGIAFSNGSLTRTFLDCAVLCFVTASMGFAFLMNIISHI